MALLRKKSQSGSDRGKIEGRKFIDLNNFRFSDEKPDVTTTLKVAEIYRFEDVRRITDHVYGGNIVLLDCSNISNDDLLMRRVIEEVKAIGREANGDVAGLGKNIIAITPKGIVIDRNRIRAPY
ncbi:cell division protein SepF [Oxyplasma meridianum]|uniref:Cell division protein SepF n=1 Tax=Oxyplasma meridianum TaxID=3073602 RepID=A0AAX4NFE2_9ARCH